MHLSSECTASMRSQPSNFTTMSEHTTYVSTCQLYAMLFYYCAELEVFTGMYPESAGVSMFKRWSQKRVSQRRKHHQGSLTACCPGKLNKDTETLKWYHARGEVGWILSSEMPCQPAKFKKGRQSSKIRDNTGRRLNNTTILFTVLIFVLLHTFLNFFFTFITRIRHVYNCATSRASRVCARTV